MGWLHHSSPDAQSRRHRPGHPRRHRGAIQTFKASTPTRTRRTRRSSGPTSSPGARPKDFTPADLAALTEAASGCRREDRRRHRRRGDRRRTDALVRASSGQRQPSVADRRSAGRQAAGDDSARAQARGGRPRRCNDARNGEGRRRLLARSQPLRSLHHTRAPRIDDAGHLWQRVRDRPDAGLRRDPLRDDSRDPGDPTRWPPAWSARNPLAILATPAAAGTATRSSSRRRTSTTGRTSATTIRFNSEQFTLIERFTPVGENAAVGGDVQRSRGVDQAVDVHDAADS